VPTLAPGPANGLSRRVVAGNVLALGAGELIARALAFVSSAYLARVLGADAYGAVGFALAITLYFQAAVEWGMDLLGAREIAADPSRVATVGPHVTAARLALSLALGAPLAIVSLLVLPRAEGLLLALFALVLPGTAAGTRWIHLGLQRNPFVAAARTLGEAVKLAGLVLAVRGPADFAFVPLAFLAGEASAAVMLMLPLRARGFRVAFRFDGGIVKPLFRQASPLLAATLLGLLIYNADLILIRVIRGREEAGLYFAAYMLLAYLGILAAVMQNSLVPALTSMAADPARRHEMFEGFVVAAVAFGLPVAVGGMLLAPELIRLAFTEGYDRSAPVLALLIWSVPVLLARSVFQASLVANARQALVLRITAATAALSVLANLFAIPLAGIMGAAAVTVGGDIVRAVLAWYYARGAGMAFRAFGRFLVPVGATLLMAAALVLIHPASVWLALGLGAVVYLVPVGLVARARLSRGAFPL
jgi:O-antigen/teichoic acid export membrane protein